MQQKLDQISLSQLFFLDYINNWRFIFSHIRPNLTREGCVEHIVSMEGKIGGVLKNPKHKRKQRKKRLNMKEDDICQLSIIYS